MHTCGMPGVARGDKAALGGNDFEASTVCPVLALDGIWICLGVSNGVAKGFGADAPKWSRAEALTTPVL